MTEERIERRLAAVFAADIVGYSGLIERDETGTRARLNAAFDKIIAPALERHRGRLFKTMGDGFLAEFASVVDAVDCAGVIQKDFSDKSELVLRIGINLGDVIAEGDDLHGDGVNVAARIEALAEPGGIAISRSARDQIRDKLSVTLHDLGEIEVKNISRPVRVFSVGEPGSAPAAQTRTVTRRVPRWVLVAVSVFTLLFGGILAYDRMRPADVEAASLSRMQLVLPEEPSVAVLPFMSLSSSEDDVLLARAVSEDLTRSLARVRGLFVIASSSTERYRGQTTSPATIAEELGVAQVVRGTLRRFGERVRIDAELIDALSGRIVWSDRIERASEDVFDLQDALVTQLARQLSEDLERVQDPHRFTENPEAFLLWARADEASWVNTPVSYESARALARQALAVDPDFVRAKALLGFVETQTGYFRVADDPQAALERALEIGREVVRLAPDDWYSRQVLAQTLLNLRDYEGALVEFKRAMELEPAHPHLLTRSALALVFLGRGAEAEELLNLSVRLNPYHNWLPDQLLGQSIYLQGRYDEALEHLEIARSKNPKFIGNLWWRAATYGQLGQDDKARQTVSAILARTPGASISTSFIQITDPVGQERFQKGLRAAGLPE
ncbi:tetratricopeptide repeat protein [Sulfitobacter sp. JBTF-M27]|uniref:Tetratricopeptide repeat protein n=1 Tax=Sulfitobacter sediminilitoris TaxID=2698830 RepID=A0A6P0CHU9_9RHOB|nr:tetratricopeptide repeat protein [Sulfitobacter sediminilitoris]NEK24605.1 tetratricopeptide repeat protein [Sulfitobacter sediminilitoris]